MRACSIFAGKFADGLLKDKLQTRWPGLVFKITLLPSMSLMFHLLYSEIESASLISLCQYFGKSKVQTA